MVGNADYSLAFLLGVPRSGTTLLSHLLDCHPQIASPPEPWLMLAVEAIGAVHPLHAAGSALLGQAYTDFVAGLEVDEAKGAYATFLYNAYLRREGKSVFVDKTPRYYHIVDRIAEYLPTARFIYLNRDPFSIAASLKTTWNFRILEALGTLDDEFLFDLVLGHRALQRFEANNPKRVHRCSYDDLVTKPYDVIESILCFLGLQLGTFLPRLDLNKLALRRGVFGDQKIFEAKQIHQNSLTAWRSVLTPDEKQAVHDIFSAEGITALGYGSLLPLLREEGITDRGVARTREISDGIDERYRRRQAAVAATSRLDGEVSRLVHALKVASSNPDETLYAIAAAEERLTLIQRQSLELVARDAELLELKSIAATRLDLINAQAADLVELKGRIGSLERDASERENVSRAQSKLVIDQAAELTAITAKAQTLERTAIQHQATIGEMTNRLNEAQSLIHAQNYQVNELTQKMWVAREKARHLEGEIDRRRWSTSRSRVIGSVGTWAKWLAEGALCQVFPPLPSSAKAALKISIVTPVFNNVDTIRETMKSVLGQDYPNFEYIIMDGGSTDGSLEIIREYANHIAVFVSEPDQGMYDAIGKGFDHATGDILAYLNADDLYEHGALQRVATAFQFDRSAQVIYFEDSVAVNGWRFPNRPQRQVDFISLFKGHILFQDGVFFTRRSYNFVGGINRSMRLAGDWNLWVRLAYYFKFEPMEGHVSSFRVRHGQLSQNMARYYAEIEESRQSMRRQMHRAAFWLRMPRYWGNRLLNPSIRLWTHFTGARRLFFPIDFKEMPPPAGIDPGVVVGKSRCPVDDGAPTHLLFSSRDTRFAHELISYAYYHAKTHTVSFYPPLDRQQLKNLYSQYYNLEKPQIKPPSADAGSPYRNYRSPNRLIRWLSCLRMPRLIRAMMINWHDQSLEEIKISIRGLLPKAGGKLTFLDVGCFDGKLLDRIASEGAWITCGIEPNGMAAQAARDKGHKIWTAEVEEAQEVIPSEIRFDLIFLGQTIEHLNEPLAALVQLSQLMKPNGLLVMSTPNLNSAQIDLFGPTWAHWHPPYHRYVFSPQSIESLAHRAQLRLLRCKTWSHPSWCWLSQKLNSFGLGGSVPHGIQLPQEDISTAESLCVVSKLFYDWRKKGDYMYVVLAKDFRG